MNPCEATLTIERNPDTLRITTGDAFHIEGVGMLVALEVIRNPDSVVVVARRPVEYVFVDDTPALANA